MVVILIVVKPIINLTVIAHRNLIDGIDPKLVKFQLIDALLFLGFIVFHNTYLFVQK